MSKIHLVRHGQAGTREAYDSLSSLGQQQAQLLGEYFLAQRLEFTVVYSGSMQRQLQTALAVKNVYDQAGVSFPVVTVDAQWNEFDLTDIYRELGPKLSEIDEEFRIEYEEMRLEVKQNIGVSEAGVHRQWRPCDTKMVDAWISERLYTAVRRGSNFRNAFAPVFKSSGVYRLERTFWCLHLQHPPEC